MSGERFRATWKEPPNSAVEDYRGHNQCGEVVLASSYDSLLSVLRWCVKVMTRAEYHGGPSCPACGYEVCTPVCQWEAALATARAVLEEGK